MAEDLNGLAVFAAVAATKGFRAAGRQLGVSGSAVSQTIRQLERLGVTLVDRTTRNVRLTEAGERLYATVGPALADVRAAEQDVRELGEEPRGTLRLNVSSGAESFLSGPLLAGFLNRYPHVRLDLVISEHPGELVAAGYDAGVGLGEVVEKDMIAMPVSDELRLLVVGAPSYFDRHSAPRHPRELSDHVCINWKPGPDAPSYRWEFNDQGREFSVAVDARIVTTDPRLNIALAIAGIGLNMSWESWAEAHINEGRLVVVLEEYCPPFPGFYLYFPRRRQRPAALRGLIDYIRESISAHTFTGRQRSDVELR